MNLIKLGNLLKDKRKELNLSLRNAGDLIGISHNYLSILEKAKDPRSNSSIKPTIDTLQMISDAYKLDINQLLELSGYDIHITSRNNDSTVLVSGDNLPPELRDIGVKYLRLAKHMEDKEIPPEDIQKIIEVLAKQKEK